MKVAAFGSDTVAGRSEIAYRQRERETERHSNTQTHGNSGGLCSFCPKAMHSMLMRKRIDRIVNCIKFVHCIELQTEIANGNCNGAWALKSHRFVTPNKKQEAVRGAVVYSRMQEPEGAR